jgi:hypothetical protein
LFRLFSKTVAVAFIDDATGRQVAASNMPLDQLPDTFALDTDLDLAGSHFVVVRADPQTKAEFAETKRLTVGLRRAERAEPKDILFSVPSICGAALPIASTAASISGDVIVLHEDDWRQCEFVACSQSAEISAELSGIRQIHSDAAAAGAWRKIHVRERIAHPLPAGARWSKIAELLGPFEHISGIAFGQRENTVAKTVGARLPDDVVVWGIEDSGELSVLCVENLDRASASTAAALRRVADDLSLALIHWCRCQVYCRDVVIDNVAGAIWTSGT